MDGTGKQAASEAGAQKLRVFLSYSRKDSEFIVWLAEALKQRGFETDYDNSPDGETRPDKAISAEDVWWKRLEVMIAEADVMVFVVSPDSAGSPVCGEEISYALRLGKRVIAISRRAIDFAKAPPALAALNVKIRFEGEAEAAHGASLEQLAAALNLDAPWWREQAWLSRELKEWLDAEQKADWLLSAADVARAERWATRRPPAAGSISAGELEFLAASRAHQTRLMSRDRWRLRWIGGLVVVALVVTALGAWFVVQGQRDLARRSSAALAASAATEFDAGHYDRALRIAILAGRETWLTPVAREAEFEIGRAAEFTRTVLRLAANPDASFCAGVSPNGAAVTTVRGGKLLLLSEAVEGEWTTTELARAAKEGVCGGFSPDGALLAAPGSDGSVTLWRRADDAWTSEVIEAPGAERIWDVRFASNDVLLVRRDGELSVWRDMRAADRAVDRINVPERSLDPSHSPAGVAGPIDQASMMIGADASMDGRVVLMAFSDRAGFGAYIWTKGEEGSWRSQQLSGGELATTLAVSAGGQKALIGGNQHAEVFQPGIDGVWNKVAQFGRASSVSVQVYPARAPSASASFDAPVDPRRAVDVADLLSIASDGDTVIIAGPDYAAMKRLTPDSQAPSGVRVEPVSEIKMPLGLGDVRGIGATPDGKAGFVEYGDRIIAVGAGWTRQTGSVVHEGRGFSTSASADGRSLAVIGTDQSLALWRMDQPPLGGRESPNKLARASEWQAGGFYTPTQAIYARFAGSSDVAAVVEQEANGEALAVYRRKPDGAWTREIAGRQEFGIARVQASSSGRLVTGAGGEIVLYAKDAAGVWSSQTLESKAWIGMDGAWSPDGNSLLTVTEELSLQIWRRAADGNWRATENFGGKDSAQSAAFLGDHATVAARDSHGLSIWRRGAAGVWTSTPAEADARTLNDALAVSRDGRRIAASGNDGVRVWTLGGEGSWASATLSRDIIFGDMIALSADGRLLAVGEWGDGASAITLWSERADGSWTAVQMPPIVDYLMGVDISPDGRRLLTMSHEGAELTNIEWLTGGPDLGAADRVAPKRPLERLAQSACEQKLRSGALNTLRIVTAADIEAAPVLRGREGEDVCAWRPAWYDRALDFAFGWLG